MSDALQLGEQALADLIDETGSDIVIVSPSGDRTECKAFIGQTEFEDGQIGGITSSLTITKSSDFVVTVASLPSDLNDKTVRGFVIEFASGEFRPTSFNQEPVLQDSGRFGLIKRIHTKQVA